VLIVCDDRVLDPVVHRIPRRVQFRGRDMLFIAQNRRDPFLVNLCRPLGLRQVFEGQTHQQVTERNRIEDAGVQKGA
jgi:hypothetical protein